MKSRHYLIKLINIYQKYTPFLKKPSCVFYPTCSQYGKEAILKYGVIKGVYLGLRRILRCHPWQKDHIDPLK